MIFRNCSDLKENELVVCKVYDDFYRYKVPKEVRIVTVDKFHKTARVLPFNCKNPLCFDVDFVDMIAVYNPHGVEMTFGCLTGTSDLLEAR